jgi:hypothetical protein
MESLAEVPFEDFEAADRMKAVFLERIARY